MSYKLRLDQGVGLSMLWYTCWTTGASDRGLASFIAKLPTVVPMPRFGWVEMASLKTYISLGVWGYRFSRP